MPIGNPNPQYFGFSNFGQGTPKQVLVQANQSTELLAANPDRLYAEVNNNSGQPIWIQLGKPAVMGEGLRLQAGGGKNWIGDELYFGEINAITVTGPTNIDVIEGV